MILETIALGTAANDHTGEKLRIGGSKINANFTKIAKEINTTIYGVYHIFKDQANNNPVNYSVVESNDIILGRWSGTAFDDGEGTVIPQGRLIVAKYNGGGLTSFANYTLMFAF